MIYAPKSIFTLRAYDRVPLPAVTDPKLETWDQAKVIFLFNPVGTAMEVFITAAGAWIYPNQENGWSMVGLAKLGAWYLLMILSFVMVTWVQRPRPGPVLRNALDPAA